MTDVGKIRIPVDVDGAPEAERNLNRVSKAYDDTSRRMKATGGVATGMSAGLRDAAGSFTVMTASAGMFADKLEARGDAMKRWGKDAAVAGGLGVAAFGLAARAGINFDQKMSGVRAATKAQGDEFKKLRQAALDFGSSTQFSATEVAEAMTEMGKAGWGVDEVLAGLPGALDAAAASGESMADVTSIMVNTLEPFQLQAKDAAHVADALAYSANETTSSIGDMGEALKYVAPVALDAGSSLDEVNGSLVVLAKNGIMGSMAGTSLRGMLTDMQAPSERAAKKMKELNLSFRDGQGRMLPFAQNIDRLKVALAKLPKSEADKFLRDLFGVQQISAARAFLRAGGDGIARFTEESRKAKGEAADFAAVLRDNLGGDLEELGGKAETAAINITDALTPALRGIVAQAGSVIDRFNEMDAGTRRIIVTMGAFGSATLLGVGAFGMLAGAVANGAAWIVRSGGMMLGATAAIGTAVANMTFALSGAIPMLGGLGLAMAANPIVTGAVVIAGIAAAAYGLSKAFSDNAREARDAASATAAYQDSLKSLRDAQLAQSNAAFGVIDAQMRLAAANKRVRESEKGTPEHTQALHEQNRARLDMTNAMARYNDEVDKGVEAHNKAGDAITSEVADIAALNAKIDEHKRKLKEIEDQRKNFDPENKTANNRLDAMRNAELASMQQAEADLKTHTTQLDKLRAQQNADLRKRVQEANNIYKQTGLVTPTMLQWVRGLNMQGDKAIAAAGLTKAQVNKILRDAGDVPPNTAKFQQGLGKNSKDAKSKAGDAKRNVDAELSKAGAGASTSGIATWGSKLTGALSGIISGLGSYVDQGIAALERLADAAASTDATPSGGGRSARGLNKRGKAGAQGGRGGRNPRQPVRPVRYAPVVGGMRPGDSFIGGATAGTTFGGDTATFPTVGAMVGAAIDSTQRDTDFLQSSVTTNSAIAEKLIKRREQLIKKLIPGARNRLTKAKTRRKNAYTALANAQKALKKAKGQKAINAAKKVVNSATRGVTAAEKEFDLAADQLQRLTGERDESSSELQSLAQEIASDELALEEATATRDEDGNILAYGMGAIDGIQSGTPPPVPTSSTGSTGTDGSSTSTTPAPTPTYAPGQNYAIGVGWDQAGKAVQVSGLVIHAGSYQQGQDAAAGFMEALGGTRSAQAFQSNSTVVR